MSVKNVDFHFSVYPVEEEYFQNMKREQGGKKSPALLLCSGLAFVRKM